MAKQNPWDQIEFEKPENTIIKTLNEQAELLSDSTKGLLYNKVEALDAFVDGETIEIGIVYNFYLHAPYLSGMRVLLFSVVEFRKTLYFIDRLNNRPKDEITQDNLVGRIEEFIREKEVQTLLKNLYNSSKEVMKSQM